jgi:hypothetical protein
MLFSVSPSAARVADERMPAELVFLDRTATIGASPTRYLTSRNLRIGRPREFQLRRDFGRRRGDEARPGAEQQHERNTQ